MKKKIQELMLLNNEKGVALIVVLMVLIVISILGLAITGFAANNMKMSSSERNYQSTYYIAESGITYKMDEINKNVVNLYNGSDMNKFYSDMEKTLYVDQWISLPAGTFENSFAENPVAEVKVSKAPGYNPSSATREYVITSKGTINNKSRKVEKKFKITWSQNTTVKSLLKTAVYVDGKIDLYGGNTGGQTINGSVGTNSSSASSILLGGNAKITGDVFVGPNATNNIIYNTTGNKLKEMIKVPVTNFIIPTFPAFPSGVDKGSIKLDGTTANYTLTLNQDMKFSEISLDRAKSLYVDIGSNNRSIIVDRLNLPNGFIFIKGTGKLSIYIKDQFTMASSSTINGIETVDKNKTVITPGNIAQLEIFYKGASLVLGDNTKVYGSLFAESANITIDNGAGFQGHIISLGKSITFSGGTVSNLRMLYAPYAQLSFSGGAQFSGSIIANSVTMIGGSTITYGMPDVDYLSFFQGSGVGGSATATDISPVKETNN